MDTKKAHWETVYTTKRPDEVSWTQEIPATSLEFLAQFDLAKTARIIDIGGGDSRFVDFLIEKGYENVSVLDISETSLERAKKRLGKAAEKVNWIVSDIAEYRPTEAFDLWHDRATFHFLTEKTQVDQYLATAERAVSRFLIVATFSENGPKKCSGLEIKQYSETDLAARFEHGFDKVKCKTEDHVTPFQTVQNFTFCSFQKHLA